jgi:hypothetical protein
MAVLMMEPIAVTTVGMVMTVTIVVEMVMGAAIVEIQEIHLIHRMVVEMEETLAIRVTVETAVTVAEEEI